METIKDDCAPWDGKKEPRPITPGLIHLVETLERLFATNPSTPNSVDEQAAE